MGEKSTWNPGLKIITLVEAENIISFSGTQDRAYGHALVAGIERYPRKVTKAMSKKKLTKRSRVKPFVKVVRGGQFWDLCLFYI